MGGIKQMNLAELLDKGYQEQALAKAAEPQFPGALRVGTVGAVTPEGVFGTCHRIGIARKLGYEMEPSRDLRIMWDAGVRNEDSWKALLVAAGANILPGITVDVDLGTSRVVGHPDIVLGDLAGAPQLGLELKGIFGMSTLASVLKDQPKNENLIQAATYSLFLNIPFKLCYTLYHWANVGGKQIKPFHKVFDVQWFGESLKFKVEGADKWNDTNVTRAGIVEYYRMVSDNEMGDRPNANYVDGTPKRNADACKYCSFAMACDRYDGDHDFDRWNDKLAELTGVIK